MSAITETPQYRSKDHLVYPLSSTPAYALSGPTINSGKIQKLGTLYWDMNVVAAPRESPCVHCLFVLGSQDSVLPFSGPSAALSSRGLFEFTSHWVLILVRATHINQLLSKFCCSSLMTDALCLVAVQHGRSFVPGYRAFLLDTR